MNGVPGWPFLVARGARHGYRAVLAPDFLVRQRRHGLLTERVGGGAADTATVVEHVAGGDGSTDLTVTYRVEHAPAAELTGGGGDEDVLLDRHGRPLEMLYGLVTTGSVSADEQDMARARTEAVRSYRRFLADEEGVAVQPSAPFALARATSVVAARHPAPAHAGAPAAPVDSAAVPVPPGPGPAWAVPAGAHRPPPVRRPSSPRRGPEAVERPRRGTGRALALVAALLGALLGGAALAGGITPWWASGAARAVDVSLQDLTDDRAAPAGRPPLCEDVRVRAVVTARNADVGYYWQVDGRAATSPRWRTGDSPAAFRVDAPDGYQLGSGGTVGHHLVVPRVYELVVSGDGRTWRSGASATVTCVLGES